MRKWFQSVSKFKTSDFKKEHNFEETVCHEIERYQRLYQMADEQVAQNIGLSLSTYHVKKTVGGFTAYELFCLSLLFQTSVNNLVPHRERYEADIIIALVKRLPLTDLKPLIDLLVILSRENDQQKVENFLMTQKEVWKNFTKI